MLLETGNSRFTKVIKHRGSMSSVHGKFLFLGLVMVLTGSTFVFQMWTICSILSIEKILEIKYLMFQLLFWSNTNETLN